MSRIVREYWKWNEKFNTSEFKLGQDTSRMIHDGTLLRVDKTNEFKVTIDSDVKSVGVVDDKIHKLFISRDVGNFILDTKSLWHLEYKKFIKKVDSLMERVEESYSGEKLVVVFRGGFMTFAAVVGGN